VPEPVKTQRGNRSEHECMAPKLHHGSPSRIPPLTSSIGRQWLAHPLLRFLNSSARRRASAASCSRCSSSSPCDEGIEISRHVYDSGFRCCLLNLCDMCLGRLQLPLQQCASICGSMETLRDSTARLGRLMLALLLQLPLQRCASICGCRGLQGVMRVSGFMEVSRATERLGRLPLALLSGSPRQDGALVLHTAS